VNETWAVARREWRAAVEAPASWVAILAFALALHGLFFTVGWPLGRQSFPSFWEARTAGLQVAFLWLPGLLALCVPALTMGVWAEERRSGTEELLLSWPLTTTAAVLGKFLGHLALLALALVLALGPLVAVVSALGPLDLWVALVGALGVFGLGAVCVAVGQLCSALAREQLIAFALGALWLGGLWAADLALGTLDPRLAALLALVSPTPHFLGSAALGVLDAADLAAQFLAIALFLAATWLVVEGRRLR
jgi:ABC-2 type transport system permease protein